MPAPAVTFRRTRLHAEKPRGEAPVVRLKVPEGRSVTFNDVVRGEVTFHTDVIGDPVLVRSDGIPAYNFAVVIDDALMKVTHVIRGEDHISNTPRQILLYEAFGYTPPVFAHLSLVMGPDHAPLSKRHGATSVKEFRDKGYLPEALVNYLALIGWSPGQNEELLPADELARRFRLENVAHSAGVFDEDKLAWANRHYLKLCAPDRLSSLAERYLRERGQIVGELSAESRAWLEWVLPNMAASVDRLPQLADRLHTVFAFDAARTLANPDIAKELRELGAAAVARALAEELASAPRWSTRIPSARLAGRVKDKTGQKGKALFHPIRLILTGASEGPGAGSDRAGYGLSARSVHVTRRTSVTTDFRMRSSSGAGGRRSGRNDLVSMRATHFWTPSSSCIARRSRARSTTLAD